MFEHISKHIEIRCKYSAVRPVLKSLLGVMKCGHTRSFVFYIITLICGNMNLEN